MAAAKQKKSTNTFRLHGNLRRNGYDRWRYFFTGQNKNNGEERGFYIELFVMNPGLTPKEPTFCFHESLPDSDQQIQAVLTGNYTQDTTEKQPSYVVVRAGEYGDTHKQVNNFFPAEALQLSKKKQSVTIGDCFFSDTVLQGKSYLSYNDAETRREFFSDPGFISWNLKYRQVFDAGQSLTQKNSSWNASGVKSLFSGTMTVDGTDYIVTPQASSGYIDRGWGHTYPDPWLHLSSNTLTSIINGKKLLKSSFAVQGVYNGKLCAYINLEGRTLFFNPKSILRRYKSTWECTETPEDNEGKKIHWSASIHDRDYVIDIDLFCSISELFVRSYEMPDGQSRLLKVLSGSTATGEIRLYKTVRRTVELLEHATVSNAVCEYGVPETFSSETVEDAVSGSQDERGGQSSSDR